MADIIEVILADHRRIRRLQEALRRAAGTSGREPSWVLPQTWQRLATMIEMFTMTAEEICWLPMSAAVPQVLAQTRQMAALGADIREAIAETRHMSCGTPPWWRAVNDALAACAAHMDCVEQQILPPLARHAEDELRDRLGRQWLAFQAAYHADGNDARR